MKQLRIVVSLLGVCLVCAAVPVFAQASDPAPQAPTFRTGVDVITIDVSAVDDQGRPVEGLRAPEFVVKIDGQPRPIVSIEEVRIDADAAKRRKADDPFESFFTTNITPPEGRMIVIAVDHLNIRPGNVRPLLNTASRFLDRLSPADRIAFFAYPEPGAFVDFTSDLTRIRKAMASVVGAQMAPPSRGRFNIGLSEAINVAQRNDQRVMTRVLERECRRGQVLNSQGIDVCEQELLSDMGRILDNAREDRTASLHGLEELLRRLALIEGPKSMIILSEGLVLEDLTELDDAVRLTAIAQVSMNMMVMDVQRTGDASQQIASPTQYEDRELQMEGLRELASAAGGAAYHIIGDGEAVFSRLLSELSAHYVIGVEAGQRDRDGRTHRIDVEVRRRGVTLRSRRALVLSPPRETPHDARLSEVLLSPFGVPEVPLRVTSFAMREGQSPKVKLLLAADVGQAGAAPATYTIGWALIDMREGRVAASGADRRLLRPTGGRADTALEFSTAVLVDPGIYSLRFGVVDTAGRRGSVVREVNAWKMAGEEFASGDLVVGPIPAPGSPLVASVEAHVDGSVAAVTDVYSTDPALLDRVAVVFELADTEVSPALVSANGTLVPGAEPGARSARIIMDTRALPAGHYVVRARITRDGAPVGRLARPIVLDASSSAPVAVPVLFTVPGFDRNLTLSPAVMNELFDAIEKSSAAARPVVAQARAGRYGAAAIEAFELGDQALSGFLRGLDFYARGQLDQAVNQLNAAAGPRREFYPAAFYLGAVYANAGRDRDAAAVWQMAMGSAPRPPFAYTLFADARLRAEQPQSVIDVLEPVLQRGSPDDGVTRRLAIAYVLVGRHTDAIPLLDALLLKQPDDQELLFAAIAAQYESSSRAGVALSGAERAKLGRYARAYRGPRRTLVDKYIDTLTAR